MHVIVVGAGVMGGWVALRLQRYGYRVTLIDMEVAGHARASSGGATRAFRAMYGGDGLYTSMIVRSMPEWIELEQASGRSLMQRTGALWMFAGEDAYARKAVPILREHGLAVESLPPAEVARRFPIISADGLRSAYLEDYAGFFFARRACEAIVDLFVSAGGEYRLARARPGEIVADRLSGVDLGDGSSLVGDTYVFATGPWLAPMFPHLLSRHLVVSRQDVFFLGAPTGDSRYRSAALPVWIEFGEEIMYGIPDDGRRGFKASSDTRGEVFDPERGNRSPDPARLSRVRAYLARRFPGLAGAPLVEHRVCQYTNSPDGDYVVDRAADAENLILVGAGCGHGFKTAPAIAGIVHAMIQDDADPPFRFKLGRFNAQATSRTQWDGH